MTTAVSKESLHPDFPWFLQELLCSEADITVFICGNSFFAYSRDRSQLKGLDWRAEQSFQDMTAKEWFRFDLSPQLQKSVVEFCAALDVNWGRLDLMEVHGEMVFLEFNANGQWVFLDYSGEDGLVKAVSEYLMPNRRDMLRLLVS